MTTRMTREAKRDHFAQLILLNTVLARVSIQFAHLYFTPARTFSTRTFSTPRRANRSATRLVAPATAERVRVSGRSPCTCALVYLVEIATPWPSPWYSCARPPRSTRSYSHVARYEHRARMLKSTVRRNSSRFRATTMSAMLYSGIARAVRIHFTIEKSFKNSFLFFFLL